LSEPGKPGPSPDRGVPNGNGVAPRLGAVHRAGQGKPCPYTICPKSQAAGAVRAVAAPAAVARLNLACACATAIRSHRRHVLVPIARPGPAGPPKRREGGRLAQCSRRCGARRRRDSRASRGALLGRGAARIGRGN